VVGVRRIEAVVWFRYSASATFCFSRA